MLTKHGLAPIAEAAAAGVRMGAEAAAMVVAAAGVVGEVAVLEEEASLEDIKAIDGGFLMDYHHFNVPIRRLLHEHYTEARR